MNYLGPLLATATELFRDRYGTSPPVPVHVEVYGRQEHFSCRVLGLPDFPAQGVCFGPVIAVTVMPAYSGNHAISTWHEFAHVFTVAGTDYRIPRWLTEGISVREEGLCPVGGFPDLRSRQGGGKQGLQALAGPFLVVRDHDAHASCSSIGLERPSSHRSNE